jgi:hypothetical protein
LGLPRGVSRFSPRVRRWWSLGGGAPQGFASDSANCGTPGDPSGR